MPGADLVITVSRYCAERLHELYGIKNAVVVPELIDLDTWRDLFLARRPVTDSRKFTVLSVCRFYPRKRLEVWLRAAALIRDPIRELEVRIAGNGPEFGKATADLFRARSSLGDPLARRREPWEVS